ncbi:uncharacterized protein MYCFIDRAFT_210051 [Pseudocercospora fijiensis CIRAD86]|uniref:Uncharacterized protein n=1 Tax=Pseudocercospora fijiensis (strain CIRAD86) TaxID=383855 RepID=N1QCH4_PSEFD|nr:uncharacterized protein MYCFIDRAFT_210051 [Pseudocercospora fijiensis CIRAD86]EME89307.1 hypothetical protein MYCFIDRAFT_210051 [Pseudocercospora fijiensis CIRAD86]
MHCDGVLREMISTDDDLENERNDDYLLRWRSMDPRTIYHTSSHSIFSFSYYSFTCGGVSLSSGVGGGVSKQRWPVDERTIGKKEGRGDSSEGENASIIYPSLKSFLWQGVLEGQARSMACIARV